MVKTFQHSEEATTKEEGRMDAKLIKERLLTEMMKVRRKGVPLVPTSPSPATDEGEMAVASHEQDIVVSFINGCSERFVALKAAFRRLDNGTYGACLGCGGEIGGKRLEAIPEADLCCACQAARERENRKK